MLLTTGLSSENAEKIIMQSFDVIINCGTDEENRPFISGIYETSPYKKDFEHELYSEDSQPEEPEPSEPVESSEPSKPVESSEPSEPVESSEPSEPV